jgi:hypothetical protein
MTVKGVTAAPRTMIELAITPMIAGAFVPNRLRQMRSITFPSRSSRVPNAERRCAAVGVSPPIMLLEQ